MSSRLAVVTGASGGIGSAISRRLSADGYQVIAHYNSDEQAVLKLADVIAGDGGRCFPVRADLGELEGVAELVRFVGDALSEDSSSSLNLLVNSAAKLLGPSFADATPKEFDEYFWINVRAPFFLAQRLSQLMPVGASIVNLSSASAHFSSPGDIVYAMTKASVESLTKNMAEAVAMRGIRVNAVVPGFTNNGHQAFRNAAALEYMSSFAALGGVSTPDVVAEAVAFLASDKAARTTGALLDTSGGSLVAIRGSNAKGLREVL